MELKRLEKILKERLTASIDDWLDGPSMTRESALNRIDFYLGLLNKIDQYKKNHIIPGNQDDH